MSRLLGIDLKRLDAFTEHVNLAEDAFQVRLERTLENLKSSLLL